MKTNEALKLLIEAYYGRADETDWSNVIIEPVDKGITSVEPTNCAYWKDQLSNVMSDPVIMAKLHLVKPLGDVLKNLLDTTPTEWQKDLAGHFVTIGIRYVGIHARCGDVLGHHDDAVEIFKLVQAQVERYLPEAYDYKLNDMTSFVASNLDRMATRDLQEFLAYGSMYTHIHYKDSQSLQSYLLPRGSGAQDLPAMPMNQALVSLFNAAFDREYSVLNDFDHEPGRDFSQGLLRLCHTLSRLESEKGHIPGCQLADLLLVSQTVTALAKAYTLADDPVARTTYEEGAVALVDLTLNEQGKKIAQNTSVCRLTAQMKKPLEPHKARRLTELIASELNHRPVTDSAWIEAAALRLSRQVYLELAYKAHQFFFNDEQKKILSNLADTAREGLVTKRDFASLAAAQKRWLALESGDEKTKMTILQAHPELRKDAFVNDLGL